MHVIATKQGHDGTQLREPGETFEMPDGSKATWFKPAGGEPPPVDKPAAATRRRAARPAGGEPPDAAHADTGSDA